jgi:hypothetical protein
VLQPRSPFASIRQAWPGTPPGGPEDRPKSNGVGNHFHPRTLLRFRSPNPDDLPGEHRIRAPFGIGQLRGDGWARPMPNRS